MTATFWQGLLGADAERILGPAVHAYTDVAPSGGGGPRARLLAHAAAAGGGACAIMLLPRAVRVYRKPLLRSPLFWGKRDQRHARGLQSRAQGLSFGLAWGVQQ